MRFRDTRTRPSPIVAIRDRLAVDWSVERRGNVTRELKRDRPNILLIMAEDQGAQLGALGTKSLIAPNFVYDCRKGHTLQKSFRALPSLFAVQSGDVHGALSSRERLPGPLFQPSAWSTANARTDEPPRVHPAAGPQGDTDAHRAASLSRLLHRCFDETARCSGRQVSLQMSSSPGRKSNSAHYCIMTTPITKPSHSSSGPLKRSVLHSFCVTPSACRTDRSADHERLWPSA